MRLSRILLPGLCLLVGCQTNTNTSDHVGPLPVGHLTSTHQLIRPAGQSVEFGGRPVDLVASPDGRTIYVKDSRGLVVIDAATWQIRQELKFSAGGSSVHGIVVTRDGSRIFATTSQDISLGNQGDARRQSRVGPEAGLARAGWRREFRPRRVGAVTGRENGLRLPFAEQHLGDRGSRIRQIWSRRSRWAWRRSTWSCLPTGRRHSFQTGVAVIRARAKDRQVLRHRPLVDERGVAASGTVSVVDLEQGTELAQIVTGLHPSDWN